jgi:hypothetical protein
MTTRSRRVAVWGACAALACGGAGCTRESIRVALEQQRRADEVQGAVQEQQHAALCVLLFRDTVQRLAARGPALSPEQTDVLNAAWNDRDLVEFWRLQQERAAALRIVGVDSVLYGQQAPLDLLWKNLRARQARATQALAGGLGQQVAARGADAAASVESAARGAEGGRP